MDYTTSKLTLNGPTSTDSDYSYIRRFAISITLCITTTGAVTFDVFMPNTPFTWTLPTTQTTTLTETFSAVISLGNDQSLTTSLSIGSVSSGSATASIDGLSRTFYSVTLL